MKYIKLVKEELENDKYFNDITTLATIPKNSYSKGKLLLKEDGIIYGIELAKEVLQYESSISFNSLIQEGTLLEKGTVLAKIYGETREILSRERVALNYLQRLSGIATKTNEYVQIAGKIKITGTRKNTPYLRDIEREAIAAGGGTNHRRDLGEMFLIKNNHIEVSGITNSIKNARKYDNTKKIEVEVETIDQVKEAVLCKPDIIMLDNMSDEMMKEAANIIKKYDIKIEASGNMNIERIKKIADQHINIDYISIGALTHSIKSLDISLKLIKI